MVPFKNVQVIVSLVSQAPLAGGVLDNPGLSGVWTAPAYIEHKTPQEMFANYGVQLANPAILQMEVADFISAATAAGKSPYNFALALDSAQLEVSSVLVGAGSLIGNIYHVRGRPMIYDDGLPADHIGFMIDLLMRPILDAGGNPVE